MRFCALVVFVLGLFARGQADISGEEFERFKEMQESQFEQFKEETRKIQEEDLLRLQKETQKEIDGLRQKLDSLEARTPSAAFSLRLSGDTLLSDSALIYDVVDLNIGGGYNEFTGVFEPPVDGVYLLTVYAVCTNNAVGPMYIKRNGDILCETHVSYDTGYIGGTCSAVAQLSAGDSVFVTGLSRDPAEIQGSRSGFVGHVVVDNLTK